MIPQKTRIADSPLCPPWSQGNLKKAILALCHDLPGSCPAYVRLVSLRTPMQTHLQSVVGLLIKPVLLNAWRL